MTWSGQKKVRKENLTSCKRSILNIYDSDFCLFSSRDDLLFNPRGTLLFERGNSLIERRRQKVVLDIGSTEKNETYSPPSFDLYYESRSLTIKIINHVNKGEKSKQY